MLKIEDKIKVEIHEEIHERAYDILTMLYQPLIKAKAFLLYFLLLSLYKQKASFENHLILCKLSGFSIEVIEEARQELEKFLLLKTYYNQEKRQYIYVLIAPKEGKEFLKHELFGRYYVTVVGEDVTKFQKKTFSFTHMNKEGYKDISKPITNVLKNDWNEAYEDAYRKIQEGIKREEMPKQILFNYDVFLKEYDAIWPKRKRTQKLLDSVGEIATVYGISATAMRNLVNRSLDEKGNLSIDTLKERALHSRAKYESSEKNPYKLPPVRFLQMKQEGTPVSKSDQETIRMLLQEYRLPVEVCNVLIEYVLEQNQQRFIRNYVMSIASSWVRAHIDTYEKAVGFIQDPTVLSKKVVSLPQKDQEISDEEYHAALKRLGVES
ncbi:MAG: DnaD domain protein [Breznakia sp.]